jgi:hypothetical protein
MRNEAIIEERPAGKGDCFCLRFVARSRNELKTEIRRSSWTIVVEAPLPNPFLGRLQIPS